MTAAPRVTHVPPASAVRGSAIPIEVRLDPPEAAGAVVDPATCAATLAYRGAGERAYRETELARNGSTFTGEVPASATQGLACGYQVRVQCADGFRLALGSPELPLSVELTEHQEPPLDLGRALPWLGAMLGVVAVLAAAMGLAERQRQRRLVTRRFWTRTLFPLLSLRGQALADALTRLAQTGLDVPFESRQSVPRSVLAKKLHDLRAVSDVVERTFWLETLSGMVPLEGQKLTAEVARLARKTLGNPVAGGRTYPHDVLLHRLEDVRTMDVPELTRERSARLVPGFDEQFLREAVRASAQESIPTKR